MNVLISINVFIFYLTATSAAASRWVSRDTDHPGKCVVPDLNLILSAGDEFNDPQKCLNIICRVNGIVEKYSCSIMPEPKGCKLGKRIEAAAPYPKCCPRELIC